MELRGFLDAVEGRAWWAMPFCAIVNIGRLLPFIIDVAITLFCVANLGFGGGVIGGITGLFISNVISCFILYRICRSAGMNGSLRQRHAHALKSARQM